MGGYLKSMAVIFGILQGWTIYLKVYGELDWSWFQVLWALWLPWATLGYFVGGALLIVWICVVTLPEER